MSGFAICLHLLFSVQRQRLPGSDFQQPKNDDNGHKIMLHLQSVDLTCACVQMRFELK